MSLPTARASLNCLVLLAILGLLPLPSPFGLPCVAQETKLLPLCAQLKASGITDDQWRAVAELVAEIKATVDAASDPTPYEKPDDIALPSLLASAQSAAPGVHRSWMNARYVSNRPPPMDSSVISAAVILNGNVENREKKPINSSYQSPTEWDGIIRDTVLIANGSLEFEGYIYNSIVIALGPIKLDGYIYNSLVISAYEGEQTAIDVSDGYINQATVVGQRIKPGSARSCLLFGEADTDDFRAAVLRDRRAVDKALRMLGAEFVELPDSAISYPKQPKTGDAEDVFTELFTCEEQTRMATIAEYIEELTLTREQVAQLVEKAANASADTQKITLWHAVRHARDIQGRRKLIQALKAASEEEQIMFLNTLKNPSSFDVPILIELYLAGRQGEDGLALFDVSERVMDYVSRDWKEMTTRWSSLMFGDPDPKKENAISARRSETAVLGQQEISRWLAMKAHKIEHRLRAYQLVSRDRNYGLQNVSLQDFARKFFESSTDPEFQAAALPLVSSYVTPHELLGKGTEAHEVLRIAAMKVLRRDFLNHSRGQGNPHHAIATVKPLLREILAFDESKTVRNLAETLMEQVMVLEQQYRTVE